MTRSLHAGLLIAITLLLANAAHSQFTATLRCSTIPKLISGYVRHHIYSKELTSKIKKRTAETYIQRLDPSKTLFLASDTKRMKQQLVDLFSSSQKGNCAALKAIQTSLIARSIESENYVRKTVNAKGFKLDEKVELLADPDKRKRPTTKKARFELLRKYLHFQLSNYLDSGTKEKEARRLLIHRYELITKRLKKKKERDLFPPFVNAFANALDPHSSYLSADDLEDFKISIGLSLEGIGASLSSRDGYTVIEEIIVGGAADRAKSLKAKDKIVAVAQAGGKPVDVIDMELREVVKLIRGKKGTKVTLTVLRQLPKTERFTATITRDKIDLKEQAAKLKVETVQVKKKELRLGVIELPSFYGDRDPNKRSSYRDVKNLIAKANKKKVDGIVLDLSRNGGGLLEDAVRISGLFIRSGGIVATQLSNSKTQILRDLDEATHYSGPMVVLISRFSASASEILAGALKDYDRAIIVGDDHSFGKGTIQSVVSLPPGLGALKVTTGMFFRPGGKSTQHSGVSSHIILPSVLTSDEIGEKALDNSIPARQIEAFLSPTVNSSEKPSAWDPLGTKLLRRLGSQSKSRVAQSKEFNEVREAIAKAKKKKKSIRLAEVRKESQGSKKDDKKDQQKENEKSPQLKEAINILGDYVVALQEKKKK